VICYNSQKGEKMATKNKIAIGVLLILAIFLFNLILKETFTKYTNCNYLIINHLRMDPFFCNGYTVKFIETTIFTIPGLKDVIDPPLELIRLIIAWSVVLFFAFISLFLTIISKNLKTIGKLISFNKDEWIKIMASVRVWLFLFVVFCTVFYFIGIK
jgi:hypothetical protein